MIPRKTSREYGTSGQATVKTRGSDIEVMFESGQRFLIPMENLPKGTTLKDGDYNITLDKEGFKIMSVRPPKGFYKVAFTGFVHKDGELPTPRTKEKSPPTATRSWEIPNHQDFTALYTVSDTNKKYGGLVISVTQVYAFYNHDDEIAGISGYGSKRLEEWLSGMGFNPQRDSIKYSDNILPWLEEKLIGMKTVYVLYIDEKGFVKSLAADNESA